MAFELILLRAAVGKGPDRGSPVSQSPSKPGPMLSLAFACLIFLSGSLFISGCSTTAQQAAYRTAGTTAVSVDTAMKLWGTYVAINHPPASQEKAVATAYAQYQQAMANVCDAGVVYSSAASSTNSPSASLAFESAIANANQKILDLENLIQSFGVKLQPSTSTP